MLNETSLEEANSDQEARMLVVVHRHLRRTRIVHLGIDLDGGSGQGIWCLPVNTAARLPCPLHAFIRCHLNPSIFGLRGAGTLKVCRG